MIKEVYEFRVSTKYVGSKEVDQVEIEFKGDETEEEKEQIIQNEYNEWLWNAIDTGWKKIR